MDLEHWAILHFTVGWASWGAILGVLLGWDRGTAARDSFRWSAFLLAGWGAFLLCLGGFWPWSNVGLPKYLALLATALAAGSGAYAGCKLGHRHIAQACAASGLFSGIITWFLHR